MLSPHAQRGVEQDHSRACRTTFFRRAATTEEGSRESEHDQQNGQAAKNEQQQIVQRAATDGALRHLSYEKQGRELDTPRARAPDQMHEYRRGKRRDTEPEEWIQKRHSLRQPIREMLN